MATDAMWVVETYSGEAYIGRLDFDRGQVIVHNGFVGRPPTIPQAEIESMVRAEDHPSVIEVYGTVEAQEPSH